MPAELFKNSWTDFDSAELWCILLERIGGPGQFKGRATDPKSFYLPLPDHTCRIKVKFSDSKKIVSIAPGPSFDDTQWQQVVQYVEKTGPNKVGRDCSFSSFRVPGYWRGTSSGVQILPPPADAPQARPAMADHPFILEFPVKASELWSITNFRRMREHHQLTFLLNVLLAGHTTIPPRRPRHLWAVELGQGAALGQPKWVQEFYFANFGEAISNGLTTAVAEPLEVIDADAYYATAGHDGGSLRVPSDLDESICRYLRLSRTNRDKFAIAGFWLDMASRQWAVSASASFASLAIAIEALGERQKKPTKRFRDFIEQHAPGASLEKRRNEMYALRSDILHGSGLVQMDKDTHFGWSPPHLEEKDLTDELWQLAQIAVRNWLKHPPAA
jgi:hypothetical protein